MKLKIFSFFIRYYNDYLYEDSITWTTDGANAGTVNYRAGKFYCTNVCGVLLSDKIMASQMIAEALNNVAKGYVSYVGNPKLMNNVMADISIMIPVSPLEQRIISEMFAKIDNLITLHQCKVFYKKVIFKNGIFNSFEFGNNIAWEQRKLGDIGTTFTGLSGKSKEDFGHGNAKFVTYMNVFSNPIASIEQCEKIEIDSKQSQVKYGDVFFTTSSETPEEVGMSSIWLGNQPNIYLNSFCFGYRPTIELDRYYLGFMLRSSSVRGNLILLAQGISRYNISKTKAMDIAIPVPNKDEQSKIGLFFSQLDNLSLFSSMSLYMVEE